MKLLYVVHRVPYPPNKGDKIRAYNILRYLAKHHEVHLATLIDDSQDAVYLDDLRKIACSVVSARIDGRIRKLLSLRRMLRAESVTVGYFYSSELQSKIDDLVALNRFDAVICSSSPTAEYLFQSVHWPNRLRSTFKIMDLIDVDSLKWQQYSERSAGPKAWVYRYEAKHLARYEALIYREFDRLLLVSEQEKRCFPGGDPEDKIIGIPNGVDLDYFSTDFDVTRSSDRPTVVFTGMMDYWPNVEGMRWFMESVFPLVQHEIPAIQLLIVGGRPTAEVKSWGKDANVQVTGFVEDIREFIAQADVCVAPLRVARGVQNKVLEAMAMGKAVVTTPFALEGINAQQDKQVIVAADSDQFVHCMVEILRDKQRAKNLGRAARALVEQQYSWPHNLAHLQSLITSPIRSANGSECDDDDDSRSR